MKRGMDGMVILFLPIGHDHAVSCSPVGLHYSQLRGLEEAGKLKVFDYFVWKGSHVVGRED